MNFFALSGSSDCKAFLIIWKHDVSLNIQWQKETQVYPMRPRYGCQMKPLKTWRPLNVDDNVWITTVVEVIYYLSF